MNSLPRNPPPFRGLPLALLLLAAGSCDPALEPPHTGSPNFSHICCPAGVSIPFRVDGQWTAVSVSSAGGTSSFNFVISLIHPIEKFLGSGGSAGAFPGPTLLQFVVAGCNPNLPTVCFSAHLQRVSGD